MGKFFEGMEKNLGYGVFFAQSFITSALASNKGWGKRADEWVGEVKEDLTVDREKIRDLADDVEASFDDFLEVVGARIMSYLDAKYEPSEEEQANAERAATFEEDAEAPLSDANVEDFLNTFTEDTFEVRDDVEGRITREYVSELVETRKFAELSETISVVIARIEAAKADSNTTEVDRLTAILKKAGVSVTFRGDRVVWHIF